MKFKIARVVIVLGLLGWWAAHDYLASRQKPEADPHPNGYIDIVAAGQMLGDYPTNETLPNLREFLRAHQAALELARVGLAETCQMPVISASYWQGGQIVAYSAIKRVALTLKAAGKIAEAESNLYEAAQDYCDCARLGMKVAHGGVLIDSMVGVACEAMGVSCCQLLCPKLDAKHCLLILGELEDLEPSRETEEKILRREAKIFHWGVTERVIYWLHERKTFDRAWAKYEAQQERTQRLELSLAQRAFELDTGKRPQTWSDLVPTYLKQIPKDVKTDAPLPFPITGK